MQNKYANILNDDAFKVVLFTPENEQLLIKIIELLIPGKRIRKLSFLPTEQHGLAVSDKISNFDLYCTSENGDTFIVEMQCDPQESYADRMLCYATFPIRMQLSDKLAALHRGDILSRMDYSLTPVYVISILKKQIKHVDERTLRDGMISSYCICSPESGELMTESLHFTYLELGRLRIPFGEPGLCQSLLERFAYSVKYINRLEDCPAGFDEDEIIRLLLRASEWANLSIDQQFKLEGVMRTELDIIAEKEYIRKEALKEKAEAIARNMLADHVAVATIARYTGLSEETVLGLMGTV